MERIHLELIIGWTLTHTGTVCTIIQQSLNLGLIKFLVPINIHSFVFSPYKIKSHYLVPMTFSLSILRTKNVDRIFLQGLKMLMENFYKD